MENKTFKKPLTIFLSILIFSGMSIIGLGVGMLNNYPCETLLISSGLGLLGIALLLIRIENNKY